MDAFLIFAALISVFILILVGRNKSQVSPSEAVTETERSTSVPSSLRAKWKAEDMRAQNSNRNRAGQTGGGWAKREEAEEERRQTRRSDHRTKAQQKAMARLGTGTPRDKNPNRRHDWGRRGHFGSGWVTPFVISLLSAGAVAVLFSA